MKTWLKAVSASVVAGIIAAVVLEVWREAHGWSTVKQHLINIAVDLMPIWGGLAVALIVWVMLTVSRIATGRDREFHAWLSKMEQERRGRYDAMEREWKERYEQNFRDRAAEAKQILTNNASAIQRFYEQFPGQVERLQIEIDKIKHRLQEKP